MLLWITWDASLISYPFIGIARRSLIISLFAVEASNDHEIDGWPASTKPHSTKQHNDNNNNNNMMLHKEQQVPHQQMPLNAAAQHIVQQEALNDQLEDIEAKYDNKDPDSDINNEDNSNNAVNWPDHRIEG